MCAKDGSKNFFNMKHNEDTDKTDIMRLHSVMIARQSQENGLAGLLDNSIETSKSIVIKEGTEASNTDVKSQVATDQIEEQMLAMSTPEMRSCATLPTPLTTDGQIAPTDKDKSRVLELQDDNNLRAIYEWSKNELLELEAITEVFKSYEKFVQKIKNFMLKNKIDESKLEPLENRITNKNATPPVSGVFDQKANPELDIHKGNLDAMRLL